ncbi:hypothetical protein HBI56_000950 [Parastagonospora nodorum]|uniref:Uncharacterized protein n=1 Tax=Phaeosphaeria nodorum (strain SN15 / ATCC MYA-4574 / FGSC 10173) TaxID=321614 RepID=A0A7U2HWR1_PHANO|nr:hypothetical protein HBH56_140130 [Parastagonospora nodorum]QRC91531.1 hypothetical protein JI435_300630 [Parastagonospora nodorum SN15]KAH3928193.1 hypothetical protein HBH54_145270 [Parastagonospora nodorum]KAH3948892.1 hypothetical protein HBH53_095270 [Parastagonospora nodorum]KAH3972586.1 hypothetical protein HBH52_149980 [Parastagonospora nodorum]
MENLIHQKRDETSRAYMRRAVEDKDSDGLTFLWHLVTSIHVATSTARCTKQSRVVFSILGVCTSQIEPWSSLRYVFSAVALTTSAFKGMQYCIPHTRMTSLSSFIILNFPIPGTWS